MTVERFRALALEGAEERAQVGHQDFRVDGRGLREVATWRQYAAAMRRGVEPA